MKTIYKYEVPMFGANQTVNTFAVSEFLDVQVQDEKVVAWVYCDTDSQSGGKNFKLKLVGTGNDFPERANYKYLKTLQLMGGKFIMHVFLEN